MRWLAETGAFDGPEGMPLWNGNFLTAKENDLPVIVFIAPETGRYGFEAKSGGVLFSSHHKNVAVNIVHFPWGTEEGDSIAFFKTDKTEKKLLDLSFEKDLQAG